MIEVPIPRRMSKLPRDPRGYPIPVNVFRDRSGNPHFTINDELMRRRLLKYDRCPICGAKLLRFRWFVGGPLSAFHEHGMYIDLGMHDECAHYALQACPYLAAPHYGRRIDDKTLKPGEGPPIMIDHTMLPDRPALFVAVCARGQTIHAHGQYVAPVRPYVRVEYWQHGERLDDAEGATLAQAAIAEKLPEKQAPRLISPV